MDEHDLHTLDEELRAIRVDEGPKLQPLRLDQMFLRARQWREAHPPAESSSTPLYRPPSPRRYPRIYPLPLPLLSVQTGSNVADGKPDEPSTLSRLFLYPELVPLVLEHFDQPRDLAKICRVNREWCAIARKRLYEHVWIRPWEDGCHFKLVLLFDTLHRHPELCQLVKRLDVRFFPLAARGEERSELDDQVQQAVSQMEGLESLVWTRDRSLNPLLMEKISDLSHLRSLELSGHSYRYYEPSLLGDMISLQDLRIMMPDPNLKSRLVGIIKALHQRKHGGLRGLGIICQSSSLIDDAILKVIAPSLTRLKRLTLWGCTRVTRDGVFAILDAAEGLEDLSIDALPHSGLLDLSSAPTLPRLSTLSLSITLPHRDPSHPSLGPEDLPTLPSLPALTALHLTLSADKRFLPFSAYQALTSQLVRPPRKLSLINLVISTETLSTILSNPDLEELYISVNGRTTILDCPALKESRLKVFHVNAPEKWGLNSDHLRDLTEIMSGLEQIGAGNRVYEVHRRYKDEGEEIEVELCKWSRTTTPGYFQVWRA